VRYPDRETDRQCYSTCTTSSAEIITVEITENKQHVQVEADLLRRMTTTGPPTMIVALGISALISTYELNNMASWPYERNVVVVRSFDHLSTFESQLINAICGSKYTTHAHTHIIIYNVYTDNNNNNNIQQANAVSFTCTFKSK